MSYTDFIKSEPGRYNSLGYKPPVPEAILPSITLGVAVRRKYDCP
jgi:hypothetical protein